jgi:hypothetical protein
LLAFKQMKMIVTAPTTKVSTKPAEAEGALTAGAEADEDEVIFLNVLPRNELQPVDLAFPGTALKIQKVQRAIHMLAHDRTPENEANVTSATRALVNAFLKPAHLQASTFATERAKPSKSITNLDSIPFGAHLGWADKGHALPSAKANEKTATATSVANRERRPSVVEGESTFISNGANQTPKDSAKLTLRTVSMNCLKYQQPRRRVTHQVFFVFRRKSRTRNACSE